MNTPELLKELKNLGRELYLLEHVAGLLEWDEEVYLPPAGGTERAEQTALLQGIRHDRLVSPRLEELFARLGADEENPAGGPELPAPDRAYIRFFYTRHRREAALPRDLVTSLARAGSLGHGAWIKARRENDFPLFAPYLKEMFSLNREKARLLGSAGSTGSVGSAKPELYDALLEEYEPGMTRAELDRIFPPLKEALIELTGRIAQKPPVKAAFLERDFPREAQDAFSRFMLEALGFPPDRGRLDVSAHPFTTTLGADDVRITTRYDEPDPLASLFSTIHEAGHGFYELGFSGEIRGNLLAAGTSLGLHESQSRTLENIIGRSRPFWNYFFPRAKGFYPEALGDVTSEDFYRGINQVRPSFIRVNADEVTYSLHVILRYELERALLEGSLSVEDLPAAWDDKMEAYLGIRPESLSQGVLQDVHWSVGLVGYFPTYVLGNLYGAQFIHTAEGETPGFWERIGRGEMEAWLGWAREKIHSPGASLTAGELVRQVTGEELNPGYFSDYLNEKYRELYGL